MISASPPDSCLRHFNAVLDSFLGVVNKALEFRTQQRGRLHSGCESAGCSHSVASAKKATLGDVTSLNLTMLRAGVRAGDFDVVNVVPPIGKHLRSCILSIYTHH